MNKYSVLLMAIGVISLTACGYGPDSPRGFSLPEGDAVKGEQVLLKHQCLACHTIEGVNFEAIEPELQLRVKLGGEATKVTTYAELVTSIINPSHKIAKGYMLDAITDSGMSKMRNYNDVMTVTELVDLVTYLQAKYKVKRYEYTPYGRYY
jgi:mono/diheme cytochrome c family protein